MDTSINVDELFQSSLAKLGNEAKRRLIELLASSMDFTDKKEQNAPCRYSAEELAERVRRGVHEARQGKGQTTEELMQEAEAW